MALFTLDATLRDRLGEALAAGPMLHLAVLFGSRATGRAGDGSDFDVGIVPVDPNLTAHEELAIAARLSAAAAAEVDLVPLDDDAPLLGAEVARAGICLFERTPGAFAAYRPPRTGRAGSGSGARGSHRA